MRKQVKLAFIGFGNSALSFCNIIINKKAEIKEAYGIDILITAIATKSKGALLDSKGIDFERQIEHLKTSNRFENAVDLSSFDVIEKCDADVLIELSPLSITDGQPAIDHIKCALNRGLNVITANKGPIAWAFNEIDALAKKQGKMFLYETTVMDGAPVFNLVKYALPGCRVLSFEGILNTTTNFILDEMQNGSTLEEAVTEAKRRGFAETDPTMDINGSDAAAKTCALINVLLNGNMTPDMIEKQGIENINGDTIHTALLKCTVIKLICKGYIENGVCKGEVIPKEIPLSHPFASVSGTSSVLQIETDLMGKITVIEHEPEIEQTSYGIYSDLLQLIKGL